ncbi:CPK4 [Scenedesmus sp. PABB004]|nr:CPK4 [Scenedesmus sp. PABB004]
MLRAAVLARPRQLRAGRAPPGGVTAPAQPPRHARRRASRAMVAAALAQACVAPAALKAPPAAHGGCLVDLGTALESALSSLQLPGAGAPPPPLAPAAPSFFDRFALGETLGQGSYGTVRACTLLETGASFAVKILPKRKGGEGRAESAAREAALWGRLAASTPHVAALHGTYEDASNFFLVQDLLPGGDLQALLDAGGALSEAEAASAMRGVLGALAACHAADVVYGDVKPSNFVLAAIYPSVAHLLDPAAPRGELTLRAIDFGCASHCPDGCAVLEGLSGTPVYMAPEVIAERCHSAAMDVWAAGVMLYQLLTLRFPFWDTDLAGLGRIHPRQVLKDVQTAPLLLDAPAAAALSPGARDLIAAMLQRDPAARISAADALAHPWLAAGAPAAAAAPGAAGAAAAL